MKILDYNIRSNKIQRRDREKKLWDRSAHGRFVQLPRPQEDVESAVTSMISRTVFRTDSYDIGIDPEKESVESVEARRIDDGRLTDDSFENLFCSSERRLTLTGKRASRVKSAETARTLRSQSKNGVPGVNVSTRLVRLPRCVIVSFRFSSDVLGIRVLERGRNSEESRHIEMR
jgi:hypothetical protein